jgi:hypothetical protein
VAPKRVRPLTEAEIERIRGLHKYPECYCGLGPVCPLYLGMTPEQREACSTDKRATAQIHFKTGVLAGQDKRPKK